MSKRSNSDDASPSPKRSKLEDFKSIAKQEVDLYWREHRRANWLSLSARIGRTQLKRDLNDEELEELKALCKAKVDKEREAESRSAAVPVPDAPASNTASLPRVTVNVGDTVQAEARLLLGTKEAPRERPVIEEGPVVRLICDDTVIVFQPKQRTYLDDKTVEELEGFPERQITVDSSLLKVVKRADPEPWITEQDRIPKALEEQLAKVAPLRVGEKVLVGKEKKKCFVKQILPEQGCVLVVCEDVADDDDGLFSWVDKDQCSRVLVDGKPVLEPKIEIKISFPNNTNNTEIVEKEKCTSFQTTGGGFVAFRGRTPEELQKVMAPYKKRQEEIRKRHEETFEKLEASKKAIVAKIRNLVGSDAINFQESVQSINGYLCTISQGEAPMFINGFTDDEWTDEGGRLYGALPLRRLLETCNATIRWEDNYYFITANVYLKRD